MKIRPGRVVCFKKTRREYSDYLFVNDVYTINVQSKDSPFGKRTV